MIRSILSQIQAKIPSQRYFASCLSIKSEISPLLEPKIKKKIPKANKMPPRPKIDELSISEKFIKGGSGKGGQKINKTNSKVQLTHLPTGIVVTSQATRSRSQNRKIAREILAMKIENIEKGEDSRHNIVIARKQMLKQRAKKKTKAKYRKLEEAKEGAKATSMDGSDDTLIKVIEENGEKVYIFEEAEDDEFHDDDASETFHDKIEETTVVKDKSDTK
ncbi:hypothetical protein CANARDRAFT_6156 [[Candida] arabinofermentans NRRL YB-2248]|uniref:Prokaryotic-type class I peptide chain release factors domain-containing protein n=1 Tax=[Candida] arabinofermentans NRRL YB-2248 TaxID=983967 RepID=A0A1E4T4C2_9ASCO|nr:hypothetical protein CANARDRAFT_6156 [[Candida] arabinofermentans NRRL YB-2248]